MAIGYKPILTLDIDGVVAGGAYIPEWDRKPWVYRDLPPMDEGINEYIGRLVDDWHVYFVSSRHFDGALDITVSWLREHVPVSWRARGVIVGAHPEERKVRQIIALGAALHVDDSPRVLDEMTRWSGQPTVGKILMVPREPAGWWPGTDVAMTQYPTARSWDVLSKMIESVRSVEQQQYKLPLVA